MVDAGKTGNETSCDCLKGALDTDRYHQRKFLGVDETNGRFGEASIRQCKTCGRLWLHYLVEFEGFPKSGRYFMGLITQEIADALAPDAAVEYLNSLDWHFYGGSYFGGKGKAVHQPVSVDAL
jgi:hypothetical protein